MRTASTAFQRHADTSHIMTAQFDILAAGEVVAEGIRVVDGAVSYSRHRHIYSSITGLTVAEPTRVPVASNNVLSPYGYEIRVYRGIMIGDTPELVALGTFPIQQSQANGITLGASINCEDRGRLLSDAKFTDDYPITAGTNGMEALESLIVDGVPDLVCNFPTTTYTTPAALFTSQDDRLEQAQDLAKAMGYELYFDGMGNPELRAIASFTDTPVFTAAAGVNLIADDLGMDRRPAYNGVVAFSSNPAADDVYRGEAYDLDPASPTYYEGQFRRKERFYASPFLGSDAQATAAAQSLLAGDLGVVRSRRIAIAPNVLIECGDAGVVSNPAMNVDGVHLVDAGVIGLGPESPVVLDVRPGQELVTS